LPRAYIFYQFFYPDDVVSSIHFSELCAGLVKRGWEVTAFPSTRGCRSEDVEYPKEGEFEGVRIKRVWRPAWRQSSGLGRVLNAAWMILRWSLLATRRQSPPNVVIIGTDPILSVLIAIAWRFFQPNVIIAHWCFDLYPEAAFADGLLARESMVARAMHYLLKKAYRACDLVVDIGPCMRELLLRYDPALPMATLAPWALDEPPNVLPIPSAERRLLFEDASIGLLYAGSFGRAHSYQSLLKLARLLQPDDVRLAFSVRGNRENALRAAVQTDDSNVSFAPFAAAENLRDRLACADVHVVSLREEWTGAIVPSKSFGALAVGRPLLFCGDRGSAVAQWIEQYDLGWVLTDGNISTVALSITSLMKDPAAKEQMNQRCRRIYQKHFSREVTLDEWQRMLTKLLTNRASMCSRITS
jgi:colanic acid biosynthesis glycosyl transferase WcaI